MKSFLASLSAPESTKHERYGLGLLLALVLLIHIVFLFGCSGKANQPTLGDGQIDQVESAALQVAVGLAFTARPDTIAPAYAVSTALLATLDQANAETALASAIDKAMEAKMAELNLDALTRQSVLDLAALIKAKTMEQIGGSDLIPSEKKVVIHDVLAIVQQAAATRMGVGQ